MQTYRYARQRMNGQDMLIVIIDAELGRPVPNDEDRFRRQAAAQREGIPGIVVLVWKFQHGFRYLGPATWAVALEALTWESIQNAADQLLSA